MSKLFKTEAISSAKRQRDEAEKEFNILIEKHNEVMANKVDDLYEALSVYSENLWDDFMEQVRIEDKTDEQKDNIKRYETFYEMAVKPYIDKGAVILQIDFFNQKVIMLRMPGIIGNSLEDVIKQSSLIEIDMGYANVTYRLLDPREFFIWVDFAFNENPNLTVDPKKLFNKEEEFKLGKLQNSMWHKQQIKNGWKLVTRASANNGTDDPNERLQMVTYIHYNHTFDSKKNITDWSTLDIIRMTIDVDQDLVLLTNAVSINRLTAKSALSYVELMRPDFKAKRVYKEINNIKEKDKN